MSAGFTPGNWDSVGGSIVCGEIKIARCFGNVGDRQMLADARLIAAAPALYDALDKLLTLAEAVPAALFGGKVKDAVDVRDECRAALKQARGEA